MTAWSDQIETRYGITLGKDLREWFDEELFRGSIQGEFCEPLSAEDFLNPPLGTLWPGFQLPDTLPLVGNGYGDWLCMRVGSDSSVQDIVRWRHAGGDWTPAGKTLAAALLFDSVVGSGDSEPEDPEANKKIIAWQKRNLGPCVESVLPKNSSSASLLSRLRLLAGANIAVHASLRAVCFTLLGRPLHAYPEQELEAGIGHQPNLRPPPPHPESRLATQIAQLGAADRNLLAVSAKSAARTNADVAWPHYLSALLEELDGYTTTAAADYGRALMASAFTDEATDLGLHKFPESFGKFAAFRLSELANDIDAVSLATLGIETVNRDYLELLLSGVDDIFQAVAKFHRRNANNATLPTSRYHHLLRCGWDLGLEGLDAYRGLLGELAQTAKKAGQHGRAAVAQLHAERIA
jgi:hypothetical protein